MGGSHFDVAADAAHDAGATGSQMRRTNASVVGVQNTGHLGRERCPFAQKPGQFCGDSPRQETLEMDQKDPLAIRPPT